MLVVNRLFGWFRRGRGPEAAGGGGPSIAENPLDSIDVNAVFSQAAQTFGEKIDPWKRQPLPMTDENIAALTEAVGPHVVISCLKTGGIDIELVTAQAGLDAHPVQCRELAQQCFGEAGEFSHLSGEKRVALGEFVLGRRGTDSEEREKSRRRKLEETFAGRTQLTVGNLAASARKRS